jgi:hypothetical protein
MSKKNGFVEKEARRRGPSFSSKKNPAKKKEGLFFLKRKPFFLILRRPNGY